MDVWWRRWKGHRLNQTMDTVGHETIPPQSQQVQSNLVQVQVSQLRLLPTQRHRCLDVLVR